MPTTYVARETSGGRLLCELFVVYEPTLTGEDGAPAAFIVSVDDELRSCEGLPLDALSGEDRAAIEEDLDLPLVDAPRYFRSPGSGRYQRVAYKRHGRRGYVGGKGYVWRRVVTVWNPERGDLRAAAETAGPGERFACVMTEAEFAQLTYPAEDLPPMGREAAREALTARPGEEQVCRFVKRTDGSLRWMRFRYDPQRRAPFDAEAKGLLPVFDLDKRAARFVNLDAVLR